MLVGLERDGGVGGAKTESRVRASFAFALPWRHSAEVPTPAIFSVGQLERRARMRSSGPPGRARAGGG